jgi:organic hydroperoxide reductase OsmC/OhrA
MSLNVLYTAHATAVGGRNGRTRSDDAVVDVQLSIPKAMGGASPVRRHPKALSRRPTARLPGEFAVDRRH